MTNKKYALSAIRLPYTRRHKSRSRASELDGVVPGVKSSIVAMQDWHIDESPRVPVGFEDDNKVTLLEIQVDFEDAYDLKLEVAHKNGKNIIQLNNTADKIYSVLLTCEMLSIDGLYEAQVRGTLGELVKHSNIFYLDVKDSINATDAFPPPLPSEFTQIEQRITALNQHPPEVSDTGYWKIFNPATGEYELSDIRLPIYEGTIFNIGDGLKLDKETNTLSVDVANEVAEDNTKPITSAAVYTTVGNIDVLLKTI